MIVHISNRRFVPEMNWDSRSLGCLMGRSEIIRTIANGAAGQDVGRFYMQLENFLWYVTASSSDMAGLRMCDMWLRRICLGPSMHIVNSHRLSVEYLQCLGTIGAVCGCSSTSDVFDIVGIMIDCVKCFTTKGTFVCSREGGQD